jgi:hypothetical protein
MRRARQGGFTTRAAFGQPGTSAVPTLFSSKRFFAMQEMEMVRFPRSHRRTEAERSSKLGAPDEPAGDVEAIIDQQAGADQKTVRRRAQLIREAEGGLSESPRDELAEDAVGKTVDDLVK